MRSLATFSFCYRTEYVPRKEVEDLKQKASIMEKELSKNALKLNSSENIKRNLEQKYAKLEDDYRKLSSQV